MVGVDKVVVCGRCCCRLRISTRLRVRVAVELPVVVVVVELSGSVDRRTENCGRPGEQQRGVERVKVTECRLCSFGGSPARPAQTGR